MRVLFLTPADAEPGFGLAAAQQRVCAPEDLEGTLEEAMKDEGVGVIAVDERLLKGAGRQAFGEREGRWPGVLVVLPPPEFAAYEAEEYIMELIRRTIGYHVRLRP